MGTPLKASLLVKSRVISPRSPHFLSVEKNVLNIRDKPKVVTRLFNENIVPKQQNFDKIKLTVTDYDDSLLLNTPNRSKLLKHGFNHELTNFKSYLGKGTFGTVIKGKFRDKLIAVKVIKSVDYINESNVLGLSHKNLANVLEIISNSSEYTLILMEFCKNAKNLQNLIDDIGFDLNRNVVLGIAKNICEGLIYLHANRVLHLDLKPKNVLFNCENNSCKICDFGNSFNIQKTMGEVLVHKNFSFKGTPAYTAPEIFMGSQPSTKSDTYSFGILLWQLINRKNPYESLDNQVVKFNFRPQIVRNQKNDDLLNLCEICWSSVPQDRFEFIDIFNKLNAFCDL